MAPHAQTFARAEHRTAQGDHAHIDLPGLLVGVDQALAALSKPLHFDENLVDHTPTGAEQAIAAFVPTAVVALPLDRQQARQGEVQVVFTVENFRARGTVYRVGRTGDRRGNGIAHLAAAPRHQPAHRHARQLAEKLRATAAQGQQRRHRQPDTGRLAAADFADDDRGAADDYIRRNLRRPNLGLAGAAIPTAHGGLAVDKYATGTLGHVLLWHRRVFIAVDFIARTRHGAQGWRSDCRAP